ncbi:DUF4286 family protein [Bosea sp. (in: a-proteobacteria)]|uniref:DUF4286 family protein n=1 Tax=Bosea sp. (in: a-proteobacteria) TaxID=1871050 RepID=UPI0026127716|nr:DUF4286 family protein [Bosea sp. (in: a-proteobacteria)]MCO5090104.1 hypothetical protein [Bosea sp. (in: a-proteobacteria)]
MTEQPRHMLHVMMDVDPAHEEEFNRWYWEEHVPERLALPGFISARRFIAKMGEPKYLAIYELASADALETPEYKHAYNNPSPWTVRMKQHYRSTRHLYSELTRPEH